MMMTEETTVVDVNQTGLLGKSTLFPDPGEEVTFSTSLSSSSQSAGEWNSTEGYLNSTIFWGNNTSVEPLVPQCTDDCLPRIVNIMKMVLIAISCVGIVCNAIFIYVLATNKSLHTPTFLYLCNLSNADTVFLTMRILRSLEVVAIPCYALELFNYVPMLSSPISILLVSSERYLAICSPLASHRWRSNTLTVGLMALTWLVAATLDIPWILMCASLPITQSALYYCVACFIFAVPYVVSVTTVTIQYSLINLNMSNRAKEISSSNLQAKFQADKRRVVTMLMINTTVFYCCTIPYISKLIMDGLTYVELTNVSHLHAINTYLFYTNQILLSVNSSINPIIYTLGSTQCRQALAASFHALFQLRKQCASKKCLYDAKVEHNKSTKSISSGLAVTVATKLSNHGGSTTEDYTNPSESTTNL